MTGKYHFSKRKLPSGARSAQRDLVRASLLLRPEPETAEERAA
jgi:hypothetical protein